MANIVQNWLLKIVTVGGEKVLKTARDINAAFGSTEKGAKGAANAYRELGDASSHHYMKSKGVSQSTANQTKAFAKMERGMTAGLVPAYATVAANIFALTAAFGALSRAADFQVLIAGAESLSVQTGRNLVSLADSMQDVTDSAITMKEALTSASIAASAGFDNATILQLTEVARNASIALGRDMTDAMNRVFKGAIKAEPELLDELGIILRLDPAARKYAASIGKTVSELTTFEKQQAVVNEVIAQGSDKFSELSEVDVNPFTQLSAAFLEAANAGIRFINIGLGPIINIITDNIYVLTGAMAVFGNTVLRSAIPALQKLQGEVAEELTNSFVALGDTLESTDISIGYYDAVKDDLTTLESAFEQTKQNVKDSWELFADDLPTDVMKDVWDGLNVEGTQATTKVRESLMKVNAALVELEKTSDKSTDTYRSQKKALIDTRGALLSHALNVYHVKEQTDRLAEATDRSTSAFKRFQNNIKLQKLSIVQGFLAGTSGGFLNLLGNIKLFNQMIQRSQVQGVVFGKVAKGMALSVFTLAGAFGSLVKAIPFIGQIIFLFGLLKSGVDKLLDVFRDNNDEILALNKAYEDHLSTLETTLETSINYEANLKDLPNTIDNVTKKLTAQTNILNSLAEELDNIINLQANQGGFSWWDEVLDFFGQGNLDALKDEIIPKNFNILENLDIEGSAEELEMLKKRFEEIGGTNAEGFQAFRFAAELQLVIDKYRDLKNEAKDTHDILLEGLEALEKSVTKISTGKLSDIETVFVNLSTVLIGLDGQELVTIASALTEMSNIEAFTLEIEDEVKELTKYTTQLSHAEKALKEMAQQEKALNAERKLITTRGINNIGEDQVERLKEIGAELEGISNAQEAYNDWILIINENLEVYTERALSTLDDQLDYYRELVSAQKVYNAQLARVKFFSQIPGSTTKESLKLLEMETKAKVRLNNLTRKANESARDRLEADRVSLENFMKAGKLTAAEQNKLTAIKTSLLQVEAKLETTQTKNAEAYTAQLKGISKILEDIAKQQALGFTLDTDVDGIIDELIPAIQKAAAELGITEEQVQKTIAAFRSLGAEAEVDVKINDITPESVATNILALQDKIRAFEIEGEYLRVNNQLIDERIDKEFILSEATAERQLLEVETAIESGKLSGEALEKKLELERQLYDFLETNAAAAKKFVESQIVQETKRGQIALSYKIKEYKLGLNVTAVEKARLEFAKQKAILDAQNIDKASDAYKNQLKLLKAISKYEIKFDLRDDIAGALEPLREFSDILEELQDRMEALSDPVDQMAASFTAMFKAGEAGDNDTIKALGQAGLAITQFQEDFKNAGFDIDAIYKSWTDLAQNFGGAMVQAFEKGSTASKAFAAVQAAGAVVAGVKAIVTALGSGPPPVNFINAAATAAAVAAQLAQIGESVSAPSSGGGSAAADKYKESFGSNRITGGDAQTNALGDSLDSLTTINNALFGSQKELRRSIYALKKSFDAVGANLFRTGGTFSASDITTNFGVSFGTSKGGNWLTGIETTTEELLAAGLQLGTTIEYTAGEFKGSMDKAIFITKQITETDSGFLGFGGGTDVDIRTKFKGLDKQLSDSLDDALNNTFDTITKLVADWGGGLENYFNTDFTINLPKEQLNLAGLSATEQAEVVSAYFSRVGNEILSDQLPWLKNWQRAGEELLDTLIRLTNSTQVLNEAFSAGGTNVDQLSMANTYGSEKQYDKYVAGREKTIAFWEEQEADATKIVNFVTAQGGARNRVPEIARFIQQYDDDIKTYADARDHLDDITDGYIGGGVSDSEYKAIIRYYSNEAKKAGDKADAVAVMEFKQWHQTRVDNARAAWIEALEEAYGGSLEDFGRDYQRFLEAVFDPDELAAIQVANAEGVIRDGLATLDAMALNEEGDPKRWAKVLANNGIAIESAEDLGEAYTLLASKGLFAGEAGAALLEAFVALGVGFADLEDATEETAAAVDTFLRDILRQIETFGLEGKELDLKNLQFEYEDQMAEAATKGLEEMVAVETLYGLKRLEIIHNYNEEIVESLNEAFGNINDGILDIISASSSWNEVSYQSLKIDNIRSRLYKSFTTGDFAENGEALGEAIGYLSQIDTSNAEDLDNTLAQFVTFSEEVPGNLQEQIDLANELTQAIMDRYNAEVAYVEELKSLSLDIKGYLEDLAVSDLSPLTNMQMFEELSSRFAQDLEDLASGDVEVASAAGERILGDADALLQLGSDLYAIGPQYQSLYEYVVGALEQAGMALDEKVVSETEILTQLQETTISELEAVQGVLGILEERQSEIYLEEIRDAIYDLAVPITAITDVLATNQPAILAELKEVPWPTQPKDLPPLQVPSQAVGTEIVPFDTLAMIHKGEMIVPAESAQMIREGTATLGSNPDTASIVNAIGTLTQVLAESQEELIEQGERQINTTQEIADSQKSGSNVGTVGIL